MLAITRALAVAWLSQTLLLVEPENFGIHYWIVLLRISKYGESQTCPEKQPQSTLSVLQRAFNGGLALLSLSFALALGSSEPFARVLVRVTATNIQDSRLLKTVIWILSLQRRLKCPLVAFFERRPLTAYRSQSLMLHLRRDDWVTQQILMRRHIEIACL